MSSVNIKSYLQQIFSSYTQTLNNTSYDKMNNVYLCADKTLQPVYNFDEYVKDNNGNNSLPASPDAIYLGKNKFYFIEFKNSPIGNIKSDNIKNKFNSGTKILKRILKDYLPQNDFKFIFCVVYKPIKTKYFNYNHIESNIVRFGLPEENKINDNFYNEIITENVIFYKNNFKILTCV
jgi:hypothetical protein